MDSANGFDPMPSTSTIWLRNIEAPSSGNLKTCCISTTLLQNTMTSIAQGSCAMKRTLRT